MASILVFQICFQVAGPGTSTRFTQDLLKCTFKHFAVFQGCSESLVKVLDEHLMYILAAGGGVLLIGDNFIHPSILSSTNPSIHISINSITHPPLPRAARSKPLSLPLLHAGQVL